MSVVRRILSVLVDRRTYLSLVYVLLRLPLSIAYAGILAFVFFRGLDNIFTFLLIIPAAFAVYAVIIVERAMARTWFGVQLTPLAPDRAADRTLRQRAADILSNPVTWKSLAYVGIEAVAGAPVGVLALAGILLGALGTFALAMTFLVTALVAIFGAPGTDIPPALVLVAFFGPFVCLGVLLATLHGVRALARLQLWFVQGMLGMSQTQVALAAARVEVEAQRTRAETADRSRRDLVLNVSHELRNPLATIRAHVDTLRGDGAEEPAPEDRRRYLEVLNRETDRLASLVDELLTLASADTGQLHLDVGPVNAAEIATQVHDAMAPLAWRERHIQLLYSATEAPTVLADRGRLAQVLMNLVRNAITHTPEGGLVAIEVKPLETGPVEVSVSDTGAGISADEKEKIFERFYRSDASRTRATGGFGLGLAIAREMVDAMGGRISVDSSPGQGSRFTVTLARA